ncbi:MAG: hypothetical protein R6V03_06530, partial [Kiritimatiellia bacterium]
MVKNEDGWTMVQCAACGFVYQDPRPDAAYLQEHYQTYLPSQEEDVEAWETAGHGIFSKSLALLE